MTSATALPSLFVTNFNPTGKDGGQQHATIECWSATAAAASATAAASAVANASSASAMLMGATAAAPMDGSSVATSQAQIGVLSHSFTVTSTVRSGGSSSSYSAAASGGKIDLFVCFGPYVLCTFQETNRLAIYDLLSGAKVSQSSLASVSGGSERVRCAAVDTHCRYLFLCSSSGRIRIHELATGSLLLDFRTTHDRGISVCTIDRLDQCVLVGGEEGAVSVYDLGRLVSASTVAAFQTAADSATAFNNTNQSLSAHVSAALLHSISDHSLSITSITVSASNELMITTSKDGGIRAYRFHAPSAAVNTDASASVNSAAAAVTALPCLFHHSLSSPITAADMDESESFLFFGSRENVHWLCLYGHSAAAGGKITVHTWRSHSATVTALCLSPGSSHLLSLDAEGTLKMWSCLPVGAGVAFGSSAAPPRDGVVVKNLGRRSGCRGIAVVDGRQLRKSIGTVNTHALTVAGTKRSNATSSWIFSPLNVHPPSGTIYVPIIAVRDPLARAARDNSAAADAVDSMFFSGADGLEHAPLHTTHPYLREDWALLNGVNGFGSLLEAADTRGTKFEAMQQQLAMYQRTTSELYQLCADNLLKELHGTDTAAATDSAQESNAMQT